MTLAGDYLTRVEAAVNDGDALDALGREILWNERLPLDEREFLLGRIRTYRDSLGRLGR